MEWLEVYGVEDVPEGSMPLYGMQLLVFIAPNGEQCWTFRVDGEPETSLLIGTLELAKAEMIAQTLWADEEEALEEDE